MGHYKIISNSTYTINNMKTALLFIALSAPALSFAQLSDSTQRLVHLKGAVNFRDVGGYTTKDGKTVKWKKVYRSASINKLTDQDMDSLKARNIYTVIDFRGNKESADAPDRLLAGTDYTLSPAGSDSLPKSAQMIAGFKNNQFSDDFYGKGGLKYFGNRYRPLFQKLLSLKEGQSILYHCTGGRDRTGQATALLLYALGVPQQKIEEDFVASNIYLGSTMGKMMAPMAAASGMTVKELEEKMSLRPELIRTFFSALTTGYGSIENFMDKELGVGKKEITILKRV
jgi:protein-tyrosine phosphatase